MPMTVDSPTCLLCVQTATGSTTEVPETSVRAFVAPLSDQRLSLRHLLLSPPGTGS